ncbi:MAG TPA: thiol protease/hemagglutinin PrtT [Bacteroidales bacterium]|nr:thiol protease/hemagglutinin PrtT [Bacteroidales bacterium]
MKKIFYYSGLLLSISFPILCQDVSLDDTRQKAISFMNSKSSRSNSIKTIETLSANNTPAIKLVHFNTGGWVLVSNDYRTKPILGYGLKGSLDLEAMPPGLMSLIDDYKQQILKVKENKTAKLRSHEEWSKEDEVSKKDEETKGLLTTDVFGLLKTSRGLVLWNQDRNNSGGCNPSYNQDCPPSTSSDFGCWPASPSECRCDHKYAGCGAVAMSQIMWYWEYPHSYNWNIIPTALFEGHDPEPAAELARLIHEAGLAANMQYCCSGSWATTENVEQGLKDFGFTGATKRDRSSWPSSSGWQNLIRAELDAGRPVLYRGGAIIDPGDWGNVHYFVCDGYDRNSPSYFHFNWGWGNTALSNPDYGYCFTLDDLAPDAEHDYTSNQQMIIGISPECAIEESITSLPYTSISTEVYLSANTISIPGAGSILEIEPGGSLVMSATNSITLNPGFYAKAGSAVTADVGPYECECGEISVLGWTNFFACDGMLCYQVSNANTFEFEVFNLAGQLVFQDAGPAYERPTRTYVWDGTGSIYGWYVCRITFRNNCAGELYNSYQVLSSGSPSLMLSRPDPEGVLINDEGIENKGENDNEADELQNEDENIFLVPNPNEGRFQLRTVFDNYRVQIFNSYGNLIYHKSSRSQTIEIDLSRFPKGTYFMRLTTEHNVFTRKILRQ